MAILRMAEEKILGTFFVTLQATLIFLSAYLETLMTYCMHKKRKVVQRDQIGLSVVFGKPSKMLVLLICISRGTHSRGSKV